MHPAPVNNTSVTHLKHVTQEKTPALQDNTHHVTCAPVGLEPTHLAVPDFESGASTNSATSTKGGALG